MPSSGILLRLGLVLADVSEEGSASIIRVARISELGITLAVTSNRRTIQIMDKVQNLNISICNAQAAWPDTLLLILYIYIYIF
jgi:hypothetical protein